MSSQIFVDLDGVLSDFYGHYETLFGVRPNPDTYEPAGFWNNIHASETFYLDQPMMPDAMELWNGLLEFDPTPIILTGIPYSISNVAYQKRQWCNHYFPGVHLICCASRDKCKYANIGDILIDDRLKYSDFWLDVGGIFIHHTSTSGTLAAVEWLYNRAQPGT